MKKNIIGSGGGGKGAAAALTGRGSIPRRTTMSRSSRSGSKGLVMKSSMPADCAPSRSSRVTPALSARIGSRSCCSVRRMVRVVQPGQRAIEGCHHIHHSRTLDQRLVRVTRHSHASTRDGTGRQQGQQCCSRNPSRLSEQ